MGMDMLASPAVGVPAAPATAAIVVRRLEASYGPVKAVQGVSLEVQAGETFGLLGPNGAGKTTILSVIQGLKRPDAGTVEVLGMDVTRHPAAAKRRIGVALQTTGLFPGLTLAEQVVYFAALHDRYPDRRAVRDLLDRFGLAALAGRRTEALSGGQRQRLALALALVNDPAIVFLDEPTTGLDPQARRAIWELVAQLHGERRTVVLTTHYIEEAEALCGRVGILDRGRLIALDSPMALIERLEGESTVMATVELPLERVRAFPAVTGAQYLGERLEIRTWDAQATVRQLQDLALALGRGLRDLAVRQPNLEDVFIALTGRTIR